MQIWRTLISAFHRSQPQCLFCSILHVGQVGRLDCSFINLTWAFLLYKYWCDRQFICLLTEGEQAGLPQVHIAGIWSLTSAAGCHWWSTAEGYMFFLSKNLSRIHTAEDRFGLKASGPSEIVFYFLNYLYTPTSFLFVCIYISIYFWAAFSHCYNNFFKMAARLVVIFFYYFYFISEICSC